MFFRMIKKIGSNFTPVEKEEEEALMIARVIILGPPWMRLIENWFYAGAANKESNLRTWKVLFLMANQRDKFSKAKGDIMEKLGSFSRFTED